MGKPTGFLEFERTENCSIEPTERITNFHEFHAPLSLDDRKKQGARCMNCGVPFCQSAMTLGGMVSGCPLHNLIPEWNDEIYEGNWKNALARLTKTNSFPEFTGRVCPALCEAACSCGLYDDPVTVKENELAVIETAFQNGWIQPNIPKVRTGKRVAVVGSGPAGLACADRLNKRGHSVTVYEKEDRAGGLLMYGIPNMKLEKSVVQRRIDLMRDEGVTFETNADVGKTVSAEELVQQYDAVVLCCGANDPRDLKADNREIGGIYFAVDFLKSATKDLLQNQTTDFTLSAKGKNVVIVGGGDTGNDCVGTCIRQGCRSVTQLEMMPKLPDTRGAGNPWPQYPRVCKTDYGQQEAIAVFGHDPRLYCTTVESFVPDGQGNIKAVTTVELKPEKKGARTVMTKIPNSEKTLPCELLIIAAGFVGSKPYIAESFGLTRNERGNIVTEQGRYRTAKEKIFTAGDMHRGQSLVVWAIAEGRAAAKEIDEYLMGYTNLV